MDTKPYIQKRQTTAARLHSLYFGTYDYGEPGQRAIAVSEIMDLLRVVHPSQILIRWAQASGLRAPEDCLALHARLCADYWQAHAGTTASPKD